MILGTLALALVVVGCRPQVPAGNANTNTNVNGDNTGTAVGSFARLGPNAIYVADQRPGRSVLVNLVNLGVNGYIVVHAVVGQDQAGEIVGQSEVLSAGEYAKVAVALTREAASGTQLIAMLHADDGDRQFNAAADLPVKDMVGNAVWMIFGVDSSAPDPSQVQVNF